MRWYFTMQRSTLDDLPAVEMPDGLEIRPVVEADHRAIWDADNEAFQDHWQPREMTEDDFRTVFAQEELDTSLWSVAWAGDQVAGSVQGFIWKAENATLGVQRGWLEHISVRRPWRRRGLALALTIDAMHRPRGRHGRGDARRRRRQPDRCPGFGGRGARLRSGRAADRVSAADRALEPGGCVRRLPPVA